MQDLELIKAISEGDRNSFKILFKRYYSLLVRYVNTYTSDNPTSEDIVQQLFISLWIKRRHLNITKSVKGYLYIVARRAYVDYYRSTKRRDDFLDELKEKAIRDSISENKEAAENKIEKLKQIIETLPPKCREILELNKVSGLRYQEIADRLGISIKTVESQMRIAFKKIRHGFEGDNVFLFLVRSLYCKWKLPKKTF